MKTINKIEPELTELEKEMRQVLKDLQIYFYSVIDFQDGKEWIEKNNNGKANDYFDIGLIENVLRKAEAKTL